MIQNAHLQRVLALAVAVVSAASPAVGFVEVGKAVEIANGSDVKAAAVGDKALVAYVGDDNRVEAEVGPFSSSGDPQISQDAELLGKPVACGITDTTYVVVWATGDDNRDATIMATLKPDFNNATFTNIAVGVGRLSDAPHDISLGPRVACTRSGFTVVWTSTDGRVVAQWYDADGTKLGSERWVSAKPEQSQPLITTTMPDVVSLTDGRIVVAWIFNDTLQQRVYFPNGTAAGAAKRVVSGVDRVSLAATGGGGWVLLHPVGVMTKTIVEPRFDNMLRGFTSDGTNNYIDALSDVSSYDYSMCSVGEAIVIVWGPMYAGLWIDASNRRTSFDMGINFNRWSYPASTPSVAALADGRVFVAGALTLQRDATSVINRWYLRSGAHTPVPNTPVPTPPPTPLPLPSSSSHIDYLPFVCVGGVFILLMIMAGGVTLVCLRRNKQRDQGEGRALLNEAPRAGATYNFGSPETKRQQD